MRKTDLITALVAMAWGYLLTVGIDGLIGIKVRNVPGYLASGQVILYAGLPALSLLLLVGVVFLSRKVIWFHDAYPVVIGLLAFALFPVLMVWGGGV